MWIKTPQGTEKFGTHDFNAYKREQRYARPAYGKYIGIGKAEPYIISEPVNYAYITGWKFQQPIILRENHNPNLQLYQLVYDGSHTYIDNGYIVGGEVRDDDFDYYTKIHWEGLKCC